MKDVISAAVIRESFTSIVREMRRSFASSAYSSIIYEGYDFSCVLIDAHGRLIAQSGEDHPFHIIPVAWSVSGLLNKGIEISPDTLFLHNDPYTGGTHLNDVAIVYPVFFPDDAGRKDRAAFFIVLRAHWADIGGMTPGSLSGTAREILQEGLRLNHVPVPKSGESPVMDLIFDNVRVTREAKADFHAGIGTCRVAEQRLLQVLDKYGLNVVQAAADEMLDAAERRMRAAIKTVAPGCYRFTAYLDGYNASTFPLQVDVALTIDGETAHVDYAGTAAQVPAPLNAGPAIAPTSALTVLKSFLDPSGVINSGTLRPITIDVPRGTILHAVHPAPCGGLNEVRFASDAAIMGALGQAVPERMTGDVRGSTNHTYIGGIDSATGRDFIFYEYPSGGTGAFSSSDGNTAVRAFNEGENVSIQSSEMIERIYPLRIVRNEIRPDSGGPGRHRGGVGLAREVEVRAPGARFSLLSDRNLVPPYGVNGGRSGQPNTFTVLRDGAPMIASDFPGKVTGFNLEPGDIVRMESSGGGGFGWVNERADAEIYQDLLNGILTNEGLADYGAAIGDDRTLLRRDVQDEIVGIDVRCDATAISPSRCEVGRSLCERIGLSLGQMVELVPDAGPPLRFWINGWREDLSLGLGERWQGRLPPGPYRLRATQTGTPEFVMRGKT
jgi:N-methylhydantoinase B